MPRFIKVMNCSSTLAGEDVELAVELAVGAGVGAAGVRAAGVGAAGVGAVNVPDEPSVPRFIMLMNCASTRTGVAALGGASALGDPSDVTVTAGLGWICLLYTSPSPRDRTRSRMPSSA